MRCKEWALICSFVSAWLIRCQRESKSAPLQKPKCISAEVFRRSGRFASPRSAGDGCDTGAVLTQTVVLAFAQSADERQLGRARVLSMASSRRTRLAAVALGAGRLRTDGLTGGGPLLSDFEWIAKRRGRKIAKVAIARKLLTLCYYGLRDGEIRCLSTNRRPGTATAAPS
jgi:hypothetical protein